MGYIVRTSDLFQMAKEVLNSGAKYVELEYLEEDRTDPADPIPPSINFSALDILDHNVFYDFEDIDVLSPDQLD